MAELDDLLTTLAPFDSNRYINMLREEPDELRRFLRMLYRGLIRGLHPDVAGSRIPPTAVKNLTEAYGRLEKMSNDELAFLANGLVDGTQGDYGLRLQLRTALEHQEELRRQVEELTNAIQRRNQNWLKEMAVI